MKNYTRGKVEGKPAYRTPSAFITRKKLIVMKDKLKNKFYDIFHSKSS